MRGCERVCVNWRAATSRQRGVFLPAGRSIPGRGAMLRRTRPAESLAATLLVVGSLVACTEERSAQPPTSAVFEYGNSLELEVHGRPTKSGSIVVLAVHGCCGDRRDLASLGRLHWPTLMSPLPIPMCAPSAAGVAGRQRTSTQSVRIRGRRSLADEAGAPSP